MDSPESVSAKRGKSSKHSELESHFPRLTLFHFWPLTWSGLLIAHPSQLKSESSYFVIRWLLRFRQVLQNCSFILHVNLQLVDMATVSCCWFSSDTRLYKIVLVLLQFKEKLSSKFDISVANLEEMIPCMHINNRGRKN